MYAFTAQQQSAWQQFFDCLHPLLDKQMPLRKALDFTVSDSTFSDPDLMFAHTCGYPLMKHQRDRVAPVCVPIFDVPGCNGRLYSSHFIVPASSDIKQLQDCRGKTVAMNNADSNSGMNVLRHAIADLHPGGHFFAEVVETGGHLYSIEALANGLAELAAIDAVSFQLIKDDQPALCANIRIIGSSTQSCGLPFVAPLALSAQLDKPGLVEQFNLALAQTPAEARRVLHLSRFEAVEWADYASIPALESDAIECGYPQLI
ncbi:MAG: ABC-type phosphate/phosphonate transport system substrate-binding protein [Planctomycetota bacterium]|jgi:ABC-type phosphate/phosphonate transport system substrate-binding protein